MILSRTLNGRPVFVEVSVSVYGETGLDCGIGVSSGYVSWPEVLLGISMM
jgi:hypothetical protein